MSSESSADNSQPLDNTNWQPSKTVTLDTLTEGVDAKAFNTASPGEVPHRTRPSEDGAVTHQPQQFAIRHNTYSVTGTKTHDETPTVKRSVLRQKTESVTGAEAARRSRSTVSFYEDGIAAAKLRQESRTSSRTSCASSGVSGAAGISSRLARTGSVMSQRQINAKCWHGFLDCCCGSLQHCGQDTEAEMEELKNEANIDSHKISIRHLCDRLATNVNTGLSDIDVQDRLDTCGFNKIRPPPVLPEWFKFCKHLVGGFCIMLWVGSILCFIAYGLQKTASDEVPGDNLYLGCVLAGIVLITAIFSYFQEAKSSKIMDSFQNFLPTYATVVRLSVEKQVPVEELVPGDVVNLKGGDKIPADCRIVTSSNFKVDNSCLTGESDPQSRSPDCTNENPLETKNLVFFSTYALEGTAKVIVTATGDHTVMGRIARLTTGIKQKKTPLAKELELFVYVICTFAITLGIIFLILILVRDSSNWVAAVVFAIGIIIGNVPEGVLIEVALCLTLAAQRMAKHNALVKNLEAVETLGSTSTICSDKTGTLTQNKMTVAHLWFNDEVHVADVSREQIVARKYQRDGEASGWTSLIRVAAVCSRAVFKPSQEQVDVMERECIGDGSESGLLKFAERSLGSVEQFRAKWPKKAEIPFSSAMKFQASVHKRMEDGRFLVVMKGAPERVINMCSTMWLGEKNGGEVPITDEIKAKFNSVYAELGGMGERILGFADLLLPADRFPPNFNFATEPEPNFPLSGLRFVGLIALMDPPRPSVPDAVRRCRQAGIRVVMVTGDHPLTARAIANMVNIFSTNSKTVEDIAKQRGVDVSQVDPSEANAIVVAGSELKEMTPEDLDDIIQNYKEIVFARTSPQQKLLIVEGFQRAGNIVAVTGDGVNDSPALKRADIGIAMGITGSDVSKQAADMILMDDNFATIVFAVEQGRILFDNLKKTVCYILVANPPEIAAALSYIVLEVPLPMGTIAMLTICLVTDMAPAVMLAYEKAEADIMKRTPRNPKKDSLITSSMMSVAYGQNGIIEMCGPFLAYFVALAECGFRTGDVVGVGLASRWDSMAFNNLEDSYGQEWTFAQRKDVEHTLYGVFFLSMVVIQWICVVCCKTRRMSIFQQGWRNYRLFLGILLETGIAVLLCYAPEVSDAFFMAPIAGLWWLPACAFAFVFLIIDHLRKLAVRMSGPGSFAEKELLY